METYFKPPYPKDSEIIAVSDELWPEILMNAYDNGVFPWPMEFEEGIPWFSPLKRAILDFSKLHIPKSLLKAKRQSKFNFTIDKNFKSVIEACSQSPRPGQDGTWITPSMIQAYVKLHELGRAHSIEVWDHNQLVGGIYGVNASGAFAAESMFYKKSNASKLALLFLIDHLKTKGLEWIDIQVMTPHMKKLGAKEIKREAFLELLKTTQSKNLVLF